MEFNGKVDVEWHKESTVTAASKTTVIRDHRRGSGVCALARRGAGLLAATQDAGFPLLCLSGVAHPALLCPGSPSSVLLWCSSLWNKPKPTV